MKIMVDKVVQMLIKIFKCFYVPFKPEVFGVGKLSVMQQLQ